MGQCAALYRIDGDYFFEIASNPQGLDLANFAKGEEVFDNSFEGLRFVLSKGLDEESRNIIQQLFYPATHIGEELDFGNIDLENLPEDFDFESNAIYYHDPSMVAAISQLLESISVNHFKHFLFDPRELNAHEIYPEGVWNKETGDDVAFNEQHMTEEFVKLRELFETAKSEKDYILCFVG